MDAYNAKKCQRKQEDAQHYATAKINLALARLETVRASQPSAQKLEKAEKKYSDAVKYHTALQDWRMEIAETNLALWRHTVERNAYQSFFNKEMKEKVNVPKAQILKQQEAALLFATEESETLKDAIIQESSLKLQPIHKEMVKLQEDYKMRMQQFRTQEGNLLRQKVSFREYRFAREQ